IRLTHLRNNDHTFQLKITASARLRNAANEAILAERPYQYVSDRALFVDWTREGGLESVAQTGFREIAQEVARDFFSPTLEAPIFLGAAYKSFAPPIARPVLISRVGAPGKTSVQFVDYRVAQPDPFEIFAHGSRAEVFIRGPKVTPEPNVDDQTDAEW